jgi:L-seryl-tRNA(Ser) seleniumtransferase
MVSRARLPAPIAIDLVACESTVGGGALPTATLPSWGVAVSGAPADDLDRRLRAAPIPVIGRIADERLILDVRTLQSPDDIDAVIAALERL